MLAESSLVQFLRCTAQGTRDISADLSTIDGPLPAPRIRLVAYTRQHVAAGACALLAWTINPVAWSAAASEDGALWTQSGRVNVSVGGGQPMHVSNAVTAVAVLGVPQPLVTCGNPLELQKEFFGRGDY